MVNIVIIGCGSITEFRHAPECFASEKINLMGFFDVNYERASEFATKYNCKAYKTYQDVLEDKDVDGVIICVNNKYHCDMTVQALKHKKHVLCEKPISVTLEEAQEMVRVSEEEQCYLMIAHNQRFEAVNRKLKEVLTTRDLGKILTFNTAFTHPGPERWSVEKTNKTWFLNKKEAGLGALGDIGIHKADVIRWLIGDEFKYVTARVATLDKKDAEGNYIAIEDNAFAILESESGIMGTLEAGWTAYGKGKNGTMICCEKGVVETEGATRVNVHYKNGEKEFLEVKQGQSLIAETFAECIANGVQPEISGVEGMKALEIVLACIKSSEEHVRVGI